MRLNKVQTTFKELMLKPVKNLEDYDGDLLDVFEENDISRHDRLKVYHNNVVGSLTEAIRATYPLIENLVGEGFIKAMTRAFIFDHPPSGGCLHEYGAGFDEFIKSYEPAKALPYLPDMATFEFATNTAYYAPDDIALPADALAQIPPENLGETFLSLRPSATLISSRYPILAIQEFCESADQNDPPDLKTDYKTKLLIIRPQLEVNIMPLDQDEYLTLTLLDQKTPLGDAIEKTLTAHSDFNFTAFLQKHIALETFSNLAANT